MKHYIIALTLYLIFRIPDSRLRKFPTPFSWGWWSLPMLLKSPKWYLITYIHIYTLIYVFLAMRSFPPCGDWLLDFHESNFPVRMPGAKKNRNSWQPGRGIFHPQPSRAWFFWKLPSAFRFGWFLLEKWLNLFVFLTPGSYDSMAIE